jgi:hypothetical protein
MFSKIAIASALLFGLMGCEGGLSGAPDAGTDAKPTVDTYIEYCGAGYHRVGYAPPELVYCSPLDGVGRSDGQCGPGYTAVTIGSDPTVLCVPPSPAP